MMATNATPTLRRSSAMSGTSRRSADPIVSDCAWFAALLSA
jgi:hypothetical protein